MSKHCTLQDTVFIKLVLALLLFSAASVGRANEFDVWIGTTTPRNGLSKGIYHARFDAAQRQTHSPVPRR